MGSVSVLGFGAFVGVSLWVGSRLLLLARRTRQIPELAIGTALLLGGAGYCGITAAFRLHLVPDALLAPAFACSMALLEVGVIALVFGVWKVFRPGARWAAALLGAGVVVLAVSYVAALLGFRPDGARSPFVFWSFNVIGASAYAWSAFECFRYTAVLRRRARIGLVDPELAHRFLLWALAGSAGASVFAAGMVGRLLLEGPHPGVQLAQSLSGLAAGVSLWLAFFPPEAYVRFVAGEAAA